MEKLNYDVLILIFSYMGVEDLKNATLTCKNWNDVIGSSTKVMRKFRVRITKDFDLRGFWSHRNYEAISIENLSMTRAVEIMNHYKVTHLRHYDHRGGIIRGRALLTFLARTPKLETLNMYNSRVFVHDATVCYRATRDSLIVNLDRLQKISITPSTSNIYKYLRMKNLSDYNCTMKNATSDVMRSDYGAPARLLSTSHMLTKLEIDTEAVYRLFKGKEYTQYNCRLDTFKFCIINNHKDDDVHRNLVAFLNMQEETLKTLDVDLGGTQHSPIIIKAIFNNLPKLTNLHLSTDESKFNAFHVYNDLNESASIKQFSIKGALSYRNENVVLSKLTQLEDLILHNDSFIFEKAVSYNHHIQRLTVPVEALTTSANIRYPCLRHLIITNYSGISSLRLFTVIWFVHNNMTVDTLEFHFVPTEYFSISSLGFSKSNHIRVRQLRLHGPIVFLYQIYKDIITSQKYLPESITLIPYESKYLMTTMKHPYENSNLPDSWYRSDFINNKNTYTLDLCHSTEIDIKDSIHAQFFGTTVLLKRLICEMQYDKHRYSNLESVMMTPLNDAERHTPITLMRPFNLSTYPNWN